MYNVPTINVHSRLPEDELLGSKHVEYIKKLKIKILIRQCAFRWFILYKCIIMHGAISIKFTTRF